MQTSAIIIELSPVVFRQADKPVNNFNDFAVLSTIIMGVAQSYQRIDVVCDRYFQDSLKEQPRRLRGVGTMFEFSDDTPFPANFSDDFLHNSQNKNMLNEYLAVKMILLHSGDKVLMLHIGTQK